MTSPPESGAGAVSERLRAADRVIAVIGAVAYVRSQWPSAEQVWGGDTRQPPVPDDLDGVWRVPGGGEGGADRWIAVTATAGTYGPAERNYDWGKGVLAGTRDYLVVAIARLREHGHAGLADSLEREMYADRLVYLRLDTNVPDAAAADAPSPTVDARQYDISDAAIVDRVLAAVRDIDARQVERLKQPLGPGAAGSLAAAYWTLPGWYQKALLARIAYSARDKGDAGLTAVFDDLLAIPDVVPGAEELTDTAREARALALAWLSGDFDGARFVALYEDDEARAAAIAEYRRRPRG